MMLPDKQSSAMASHFSTTVIVQSIGKTSRVLRAAENSGNVTQRGILESEETAFDEQGFIGLRVRGWLPRRWRLM